MTITTSNLQKVNSTTYADVVGLYMGLTRLPGETSTAFLNRANQAVTGKRDHSYEGLINELSMELNLNVWEGISLSYTSTGPNPYLDINCSLGQIKIDTDQGSYIKQTVSVAQDNYWIWNNISNVVTSLNTIPGLTASLIGPDGPSLQIVKQDNIITVVNEVILAQDQFLANKNIIQGSEIFNTVPGVYNLNYNTGQLILNSDPASNLSICYLYRGIPYNIICSQAVVFNLSDSSIPSIAKGYNGDLVYQVKEILNNVMQNDLSYWAN